MIGSLAREDYYPTDEDVDRLRNPPMPQVPRISPWDVGVMRAGTSLRDQTTQRPDLAPKMGSLLTMGPVGDTAVDVARSAPTGVARGAMNFATMMSAPTDNAELDALGLAGTEEARRQIESGLYKPQTVPGEAMASVAEIGGNPVNWAGPGTIPVKAAWNVASGLGGEAGAQLAKGTDYEKYARLAGSFGPAVAERAWYLTGPAVRSLPEGTLGMAGGKVTTRARDPALYSDFSKIKMRKPLSEMEADRVVTRPVNERIISPEQLQGATLSPAYGDLTIAGERLRGVGGTKLSAPVDLQGGAGYMSRSNPYVWASERAQVTGLANRLNNLSDKLNTDQLYLVHTPMSARAADFSHHVSDTLAGLIPSSEISKKTAQNFDRTMRRETFQNFGPTPDFPGILSPNLRAYLTEPVLGRGNTRSKMAKLADTSTYQTAGFPDVAEARFAVTRPDLVNERGSGLGIARVNPNLVGPSEHRTYNTGIGGAYAGRFEYPVPNDILWRDIYQEYARRGLTSPTHIGRSLMTGSPRGEFYQRVDQPLVDDLMRYLERRRSQGSQEVRPVE